MRKSSAHIAVPGLLLPLLFFGCGSGDTGAPGPAGPSGAAGPGIQASETCVLCHAEGRIADVAVMHADRNGATTATITGVTFTPHGSPVDNYSITVNFTYAAADVNGTPADVDLTTLDPSNSSRFLYVRVAVAKLLPGQVYITGASDPSEWDGFTTRDTSLSLTRTNPGTLPAAYTYTLNTVVPAADDNATVRAGLIISGIQGLTPANATFDRKPNGTANDTRNIVTTAACNECHDPLGVGAFKTRREFEESLGEEVSGPFHGGARRETSLCVVCHHRTRAAGEGRLGVMVHKIHSGKTDVLGEIDYSGITFPQDLRNCTKCHKGGSESDNWKARPSITYCGSCHTSVNFATGAGHGGGVQADNRFCALCHPATGPFPSVTAAHLTVNATPNNPDVPGGLASFKYFIDNVAVDNTGVATVTFRIEKDGAPLDLSTYPPAGFTGGPNFLLAWALPQDGIGAPADYNNIDSPAPPSSTTGNGAGDAPSVSLASLAGSLTVVDNAAKTYRASLTTRPFPAGATMRSVAMESFFTQSNVDIGNGPENVGRHTPSVAMAVPGDAVRRQVVKSGYDAITGQPFGCLECHEILELHGGSRVNNPQVCVMCHNPDKSSSGRTVDPANISPDVVAAVGSNPLTYPEAALNFKNMIHGIHAATDRPYEFVRNRQNGFYYNWSEVTFPGNLMHCTKCHIGDSYRPGALPAGVLYNVERTTTGNPNETRADIIAARESVPNLTDLVDSPIAGACYYCHDSTLVRDHIVLNGGDIRTKREDTFVTESTLAGERSFLTP